MADPTEDGNVFHKLGYLSGTKIRPRRRDQAEFRIVDLTEVQISRVMREAFPESVLRELTVIPLCCEQDGTVVVAMHDPFEYGVVDRLQFVINQEISVVVASSETILSTIERHFG